MELYQLALADKLVQWVELTNHLETVQCLGTKFEFWILCWAVSPYVGCWGKENICFDCQHLLADKIIALE